MGKVIEFDYIKADDLCSNLKNRREILEGHFAKAVTAVESIPGWEGETQKAFVELVDKTNKAISNQFSGMIDELESTIRTIKNEKQERDMSQASQIRSMSIDI